MDLFFNAFEASKFLKKETTKPAAANFLQQARFDKFAEVFNNQRIHEALDMKCPAEIYRPATRCCTGQAVGTKGIHDDRIGIIAERAFLTDNR